MGWRWVKIQVRERWAAEPGYPQQSSLRCGLLAAIPAANTVPNVLQTWLKHGWPKKRRILTVVLYWVNVRVTQEVLGHSRPDTTMIYMHATRKYTAGDHEPTRLLYEP